MCACATLGQKLGTVAGLRRHCDILGRMVRESDIWLLLLESNNYLLLKRFESTECGHKFYAMASLRKHITLSEKTL